MTDSRRNGGGGEFQGREEDLGWVMKTRKGKRLCQRTKQIVTAPRGEEKRKFLHQDLLETVQKGGVDHYVLGAFGDKGNRRNWGQGDIVGAVRLIHCKTKGVRRRAHANRKKKK